MYFSFFKEFKYARLVEEEFYEYQIDHAKKSVMQGKDNDNILHVYYTNMKLFFDPFRFIEQES